MLDTHAGVRCPSLMQQNSDLPAGLRIEKLADLPAAEHPIEVLDRIFFEASTVKTFASPEAKAEFRERWLGRYLTHDVAHCFIARTDAGETIGYVVGSIEDPAKTPRFADVGYFSLIAPLTSRYPAHLHINLAPAWRSRGIGRIMIEVFKAHAAAHGRKGLHVVTGFGVRNVGFYLRNGFRETARFEWQSRPLVMLSTPL